MSTPGLMFVTSRIIDPSKTSTERYNEFYNQEHLPDVLTYKHAGKPNIALRYKNANPDSAIPYLALYPLEDAAFLTEGLPQLVEDTKISKTFGGANIMDLVDFGLRPYDKIQTFDGFEMGSKPANESRGQTIVAVAIEPGAGQEDDFDDWYRKQHLDMMSMLPHYRRSTRYKRIDGVKPRYLALHEYGCKAANLDAEGLKIVVGSEWSRKILSKILTFQRDVFELIEVQGNGEVKL